MTSKTRQRRHTILRPILACALWTGALAPGGARASGYYLLEADLRAGVAEGPTAEGGLGLSLYSDELAAWVTVGDDSVSGGRRVKEWWIESRVLGPVMGTLPPSMAAAGFDEPTRVGKANLWIPFRSWSFGADYTTGRWLEWDASHHLLLNLTALTRFSHRRLLFGPTVGIGANLTWWEGWRGDDSRLINTGKISAEAGWVAGFCLGDVSYAQARLLTWVDAFGLHQHQLRFAGVLGVTGIERGVPLGIELQWELERGDDTVDALPGASSTVSLAATWRLMPSNTRVDPKAVIKALEGIEAAPEDRSPPLPLTEPEPEPEPEPELEPEPEPEPEAAADTDTAPPAAGPPEDDDTDPEPPGSEPTGPHPDEDRDSGRGPQGPSL